MREHARRFHFLRQIASGGFGTVHLVKVRNADGFSRLVAVKLLKTQWSGSQDVARRMRDEARLLGLLRHRNIVDVLDLTRIDGRAAVVMEYIEGIDLKQLGESLAEDGRTVPLRPALEIAAAVAGALDAAYNRPPMPGEKPLRVIHRDIKPSNIMVDESARVKVLDFGVARSEIEGRESHTEELQYGSVDYMAPERLFFEPETPSSDVYSLGATLFEVLSGEKLGKARGRPARHAEHLAARFGLLPEGATPRSELHTALVLLLRESLAFNLEERPTAAEFYQRARTLARLAPGDDLSAWCERVLPPLVPRLLEARRTPSPLDDSVFQEDSKAFSSPLGDALPPGPSAEALRRGALAELEESMDQVLAQPPTGALRGTVVSTPVASTPEPDPEDAWEDGPTQLAFARDTPDLAAVLDGLDAPLDTEEAVRRTARGAAARDLPPDPADPFAVLTEASSPGLGTGSARVRVQPVPIPSAPPSSPRGRLPQVAALDTVPDLDLDAPFATGPAAPVPQAPISQPQADPSQDATDVLAMPSRAAVDAAAVRQVGAPGERGAVGAENHEADEPSLTVSVDEQTDALLSDVVVQPSVTQAAPEATHVSPILAGAVVEETEAEARVPSAPPLEASSASQARPVVVAVAAAAVGLSVFAVGVSTVYTRLLGTSGAPAAGTERTAVASPDPPRSPTAAPSAGAVAGPALVFRSSLDDLRKLTAQCDTGSGKGPREAVVPGDAADRCTVTAILNDRSRRTAVLQAPVAGVYQCFDHDSTCEAQ